MLDGFIPPLTVLVVSAVLIAAQRFYFPRSRKKKKSLWWTNALIIILILALAGSLEFEMGRTPSYKYGGVRLWSGNINSSQNSQQITDPYTFTHITHGVIFYGLLSLAAPGASVALRALIGVALESAWEVFENTDFVVNRYRAATISLDYYGDSIVNSLADILACLIGFFIAWRLPTWGTVIFVIVLEVGLALWIRDGLFLNILMLIYPIPAIKAWQMAL